MRIGMRGAAALWDCQVIKLISPSPETATGPAQTVGAPVLGRPEIDRGQ